jgi:hypothetical protein
LETVLLEVPGLDRCERNSPPTPSLVEADAVWHPVWTRCLGDMLKRHLFFAYDESLADKSYKAQLAQVFAHPFHDTPQLSHFSSP